MSLLVVARTLIRGPLILCKHEVIVHGCWFLAPKRDGEPAAYAAAVPTPPNPSDAGPPSSPLRHNSRGWRFDASLQRLVGLHNAYVETDSCVRTDALPANWPKVASMRTAVAGAGGVTPTVRWVATGGVSPKVGIAPIRFTARIALTNGWHGTRTRQGRIGW